MALVYAGLEDYDSVMKYLERGYRTHSMYIYYMTTDPILVPMRSDKRFISLAKQMELLD